MSKRRQETPASMRDATVSAEIITKQMKCVKQGGNVFVFVPLPTPTRGRVLVVLGLYPHAKADTVPVSQTERGMRKELGVVVRIIWVDLCVFSSTTINSIFDQDEMALFAADAEMVRNYFKRLGDHLRALGTEDVHVVYVAGETCQAALKMAIDMRIVTREPPCMSSLHEISLFAMGDVRFVALENAPHPSWHLMMKRAPLAVRIFEETMCSLNGMLA